ncbi:MYND-type domain-containing protein [Mycena indigotica]|uniref:MYND-type domain-containing protein n=1 Tax=Mycena indigotica TaxID=2126181 RepID=A0A8H6VUL1_9AGAR|nr:MYND-type domain-containing protein [Mycena indigotica]KAF7290658.1 MYND-type domain-containing protein [Mycena indigotica]
MAEKPVVRNCSRTQAAGLICVCANAWGTTLSRCSKCKRVYYCSSACQTRDWPHHKTECKVLRRVNKYDADKGHTLSDPSLRLAYHVAEEQARCRVISDSLGPSPYSQNPPLITYGMKCQVCFRTPFHDINAVEFTPCPTCKLAWWCSPECASAFSKTAHTKQHCEDLACVGATDSVYSAYIHSRKKGLHPIVLRELEMTQPVYIPPSSLTGWADYRKRVFPRFALAADFTAREFSHVHPQATRAVEMLATEPTSLIVTLLRGLEIALPDLPTRKSLCIHFVGSSLLEISSQAMNEELLHYLPHLKSLKMVYVGPGVASMSEGQPEHTNLACNACTGRRRLRFSILRDATYHDFAQTSTFSTHTPDLIAGFHTGMGEVDTDSWRTSVSLILAKKIPALFTTYSLPEAMHDTILLRSLGAVFVKELERNIWRGEIPHPREQQDLVAMEASHYTNNYFFIVRGSSNTA